MTPQTMQQRIAHWMGWTLIGDNYWLVPAELDTSPAPGLQSGEPRRLPDLTTFVGRAEWVSSIKAKFTTCAFWFSTFTWEDGSVNVDVYAGLTPLASIWDENELAALTAAVLVLMESEK